MRGFGLWAVGLLLAVLVLGCGSGGDAGTTAAHSAPPKKLRQLKVTLDGWKGPQAAGLVMAQERGYFTEAGLEVEVLTPATPERSVEYVVNGTDDLGIVQEPEDVLAMARVAPGKQLPVVIVGTVISQPTAAMIWTKESGIHDVSDLKGKTIAYPGLPFQRKLLENILAQEGLTRHDVTIKEVGYKLVPALIGGRADAIFGGSSNLEGIELESRGVQPVITPVQHLGIPTYDELVVIARTPLLGDRQLVRAFMSALARGTAAAVEEPAEVFRVLEGAVEANPSTSPKALREQVKATLPLLSKNGYVNQERIEHFINWMHAEGMIQSKVGVAGMSTNYYR